MPRDKGSCLTGSKYSRATDTNGIGFASDTIVSDINIVVTGDVVASQQTPKAMLLPTASVVKECAIDPACVEITSVVAV